MNLQKLKKLARLSINLGILYNIIILSDQVMTVFVYDLPGLLISEKITHVTGMFKIDRRRVLTIQIE